MACHKGLSLKLSFNQQTGAWSVSSEVFPLFGINTAVSRVYVDRHWLSLFQGGQTQVRKERGSIILEERRDKRLVAQMSVSPLLGMSAVRLQLELKNNSSRTMVVGPLHLLDLPEGCVLGEPAGSWKVYVDSGGGWWAGVEDMTSGSPFPEEWGMLQKEEQELLSQIGELSAGQVHRSAGGISVLHSPESQTSLVLSFLTWNRTINNVTWIYGNADGQLRGWAGCDFAGCRLKPGESITSDKLFLGVYASPFTGLEDYAKTAGKLTTPKLPEKPPLGWCSWYGYRLNISEESTLENAALIKKRYPGYPFSYIQVDHGWQFQNLCGSWTVTNERFPGGIEWLSRRLGEMGYMLGLWLGIFTVLESSPVFKAHPEFMIQDQSGKPREMPYRWSWPPHEKIYYYLDPTHPGTQQFLRETLIALRKAGVRYWKFDFTWGIADTDEKAMFHNKSLVKGAEIYREGCSLIRRILKDDYLYWCSCPVNLGFGLGTTTMSACDIGNTGFSLSKQVEGRVEDLNFFRRNATTIISRYFLHKNLILLNPDVVEVGGPGNYEEGKIRLTLVALCGGQVFLGDDLTRLSDKEWNLLAKCIPPYGEIARPVDLFEHTHPTSYPQIWHLPIKTAWGSWEIVGLFNLTQEPSRVEVDFSSLRLKKNEEYLVYEFWNKRFLGRKKNSFKISLAPTTTKLLLIKEVPDHPIVLSTDLHFTQGGVELFEVKYSRAEQILSGRAKRQQGERGNLFIFVPEGYEITKPLGLRRNQRVAVLPVQFEKADVRWKIRFSKRDR